MKIQERGVKNAKQEASKDKREASVLPFIGFISSNMWTQRSDSADEPAMPEATKEATLSAECGHTTTIVSLQDR